MKRSTAAASARPSVYDVAEAAGVSVGTVSRVLNGADSVRDATRARVQASILRLGFEPNRIARSLASGVTHSIALVVPDLANPFFAEIASGVMEAADERGYVVVVCGVGTTADRERRYLEKLLAQRVDGLLLIGSTLNSHDLRQLSQRVPVVMVDRERRIPEVRSVKVDHRRGATLAVQHLISGGHRDIAFLAGPNSVAAARERRRGVAEAMALNGLAMEPSLVATGHFDDEGGATAMTSVLSSGASFSAVFASNDLMAIGAASVLKASGRRVPTDVSLVGFDDIHLARHLDPPLTTVRQPAKEMGLFAARLIMDSSSGEPQPKRVVLPPTIVVRGSTENVVR